MDELALLGAALVGRAGDRPTARTDLENLLSLELHWFKPSQAKLVVTSLLERGLLVEGADGLCRAGPTSPRPEVPAGYSPPPGLVASLGSTKDPSLRDRILASISRDPGAPATDLEAEADTLATTLHLEPEVAALLVAWRHGVALPDLRKEVEKRLRSAAHHSPTT